LRKLNRASAQTLDSWLRHSGYDPQEMAVDDMIAAAYEMQRWLRGHFKRYTTLSLALGMLALQNGGEV
jgi:hypothetical protein